MAEAQDIYRSDDSWNVDDDGVQYDSSLFIRNEDFLDLRNRTERGFVRLTSGRTESMTHPHDDYYFSPADGELPGNGSHYILREKPKESKSQGAIVAAIPEGFVDRPEYAHDHSDGGVVAAQRNLRDAYNQIRDARLKMKRAYPEQRGALSAVHRDLKTVLQSIENRRNPPRERPPRPHDPEGYDPADRPCGRIYDLMESERGVSPNDIIGLDGRLNPGGADD